MKWKYCLCLFVCLPACVHVCVLILILTNKAACFIYHNQQHSNSVTAIFHFSRLKWCVRNVCTYAYNSLCLLFFGGFSVYNLSFFFFFFWSVCVFLRVYWSFVSWFACLVACIYTHTNTHWFSPMYKPRLGRRKITRFPLYTQCDGLCARAMYIRLVSLLLLLL